MRQALDGSRTRGKSFERRASALVCSEFSAFRYGSVNAGSVARSPKSSRFLTKASGSSRCWAARRCSCIGQLIDYFDRLALLVDPFGVAGPTGNHGCRQRHIPTSGKILSDDRNQPRRNALRALGAEPSDRVPDRRRWRIAR